MSPRERIASARIYLVCDARSGGRPLNRSGARALRAFLDAALAGGVDVIQLRDKALAQHDDADLMVAADIFRRAADAAGALFILNDQPNLVDWCCADGVHIGQDDGSVAGARALVGPGRIVGRSTHAPDQGAAADADPDVDYLAVGPVHATPTKPGRPAAGLAYVDWAAANVTTPWFAIGGLDAGNAGAAAARGARRIVVVRAITEAADPEAAARALRDAVTGATGAKGSDPQNGAAETGGRAWGSDPSRQDQAPSRRVDSSPQDDRMARGYARGRERDAAARAALKPLAPGERPRAVTIGAIVAVLLGLSNVVLLAAGYEVQGDEQQAIGVVIFALLMASAAIGMWQVRYWAVLGFQALLGIAIVFSALSLMVASNLTAALLCLLIIAGASPLFWFLIRAMARIQMPTRRPREPVG